MREAAEDAGCPLSRAWKGGSELNWLPVLREQRAALHLHADEVAVGNAAGVAAFPVGWAVRVAGAGGGGELGVGRQETRAGGLSRGDRQGGQELRDRGDRLGRRRGGLRRLG